VLIVVANLLLFFVYQQTQPAEGIYGQAWDYLQSQSFLAITGSLLFPIGVFLVENRLQIIQKRADEKKELRVKCLKKTEDLWDNLQSVAFEVANFDAKTATRSDFEKIIDKVHDFKNSGEKVVPEWLFRFPEMDVKTILDIVALIDVVSDPTYAIAYRLLDAPSDVSTSELQGYLGTIADVVDGIVRYSIISVFSLSIEIDDPATGRRDRERKETARQNQLALLDGWATGVRAINQRLINVGPFMTGKNVEDLREVFSEIEGEARKNHARFITSEEFERLRAAYANLTSAEMTNLLRYGVNGTSQEVLRQTAGWLSTQWLRIEIEQRLGIENGRLV
jgi:hypothetical protein